MLTPLNITCKIGKFLLALWKKKINPFLIDVSKTVSSYSTDEDTAVEDGHGDGDRQRYPFADTNIEVWRLAWADVTAEEMWDLLREVHGEAAGWGPKTRNDGDSSWQGWKDYCFAQVKHVIILNWPLKQTLQASLPFRIFFENVLSYINISSVAMTTGTAVAKAC